MAGTGKDVIRHQVLLKLANKEDKEKVAASMLHMKKGLTGVTFLSFNVVTDLGLGEMNADVSVIADFPDKENLAAYATHPTHIESIEANKSAVVGLMVIQYSPPTVRMYGGDM